MVVRVLVDEDSSFVHGGTPWAWLDWGESWANGSGLKARNGNAPEEWCRECVYRVSCRVSPEGAWDPDAQYEDGDLYLPPVTTVNGRPVVSVHPERHDGGHYSDVYPNSGWEWVIELGDAP